MTFKNDESHARINICYFIIYYCSQIHDYTLFTSILSKFFCIPLAKISTYCFTWVNNIIWLLWETMNSHQYTPKQKVNRVHKQNNLIIDILVVLPWEQNIPSLKWKRWNSRQQRYSKGRSTAQIVQELLQLRARTPHASSENTMAVVALTSFEYYLRTTSVKTKNSLEYWL